MLNGYVKRSLEFVNLFRALGNGLSWLRLLVDLSCLKMKLMRVLCKMKDLIQLVVVLVGE